MKQIRLLAQYYVDLMMKLGQLSLRSMALINICQFGSVQFFVRISCHCGTNGGNHGAAWSGRKH